MRAAIIFRPACQPFARAVCRSGIAYHARCADFGGGLEPLAQRLGDIGHGVKIVDARLMYPMHQLPRAKRLFAHFRAVLHEPVFFKFEQVGCHGLSD